MTRLHYNGLATGAAGATVSLALGGSLTNSATAVTFNAALTYANGTAVPTITGSDYIPLEILDVNGHLSEIVWLTAYTSAATSGTITRGKEGTAGVVHASGDKIVHAVLADDVAPDYITTFTPALTASTSNPTLGTASIAECRYRMDGKHVVGDIIIKFGTSGVAVGSGGYRVSLPVAARESAAGNYLGYARGYGFLFDDSAAAYRGVTLSRISTTTCEILVVDGSAFVSNASPWTWAANDALILHFDYEAA